MANGFTITAYTPSSDSPPKSGTTYGPAPRGQAAELGPEPIVPLPPVGSTPPRSASPAALTGTTADDILRRIAAGEDIEITPQVIAQIAMGPQRQTPAATPLPTAGSSGYTVTAFTPAKAPTPPAQPPPQTFQHFVDVLGESSAAKFFEGLIGGGGQAVMGAITGQRDRAAESRLVNSLKTGAAFLQGEPSRVWNELAQSGEALQKGDLNTAADHLWFSIPMMGAAGTAMKDFLDRGDYLGALAHGAGVLGSTIASSPESRVAVGGSTPADYARSFQYPSPVPDVLPPGAAGATRGAVRGAVQAATETVPLRKFGIDINVPKPLVTGAAGGTAAAAMGLPKTVGAVTGAVAPIIRGAIRGARGITEAVPEAVPRSAGQVLAESQGIAWDTLRPEDQALYEHAARGQANVAAQRAAAQQAPPAAEPTPAAPVPQPTAPEVRLNREARRATAAVPEMGTVATPGPSLTQDESLMLQHLGFADPFAADADTIAAARQLVSENPELVGRLRTGEPIPEPVPQQAPPVAAPSAPAEAAPKPTRTVQQIQQDISESWARMQDAIKQPQTAATEAVIQREMDSLRALQQEPYIPPGSIPPIEQSAPAIPSRPIQPEVTPAPATGPSPAEAAIRLEAAMRPEMITDYLVRNQIPSHMVNDFGDSEWNLVSQQAGLTNPPTPEEIRTIRSNVANYENAATMRQPPAGAAAAVEQFQRQRTTSQRTPRAAPVEQPAAAPQTREQIAQSLSDLMRESGTAPPVQPVTEVPPLPTASEARIEAFAQHFARDPAITTEDLQNLQTDRRSQALLERLGQSLGIEGRPTADELRLIADRVRQLRGQGTIPSDVSQTSTGPPVSGTGGAIQAPVASGDRSGTSPRPVYPAASGSDTTIRIPGESNTYPARYTVRELADVHPSHNPHTFQPNPRYTLRNDRNYGDAANQERIVLDSQPGRFVPEYLITDSPDAVNGPPVIEAGGNILGGNSRAMKLGRVYQNNPQDAAAYRALLEQAAPRFGIDPATIRNMQQPILVRELTESAHPQRLITDLNKSGTAALTATERATADARRLSADAADYLAKAIEHEGTDATLNDALSGKQGARIINQLVDDGVFTMQEKPALVDARTGAVTAHAKERISKMLLGQVFADADQMARTPAEIRNKLERIIAPLLQSSQKTGFDLIPQVRQSLDLLEYARAHGITNMGDVLGQTGLFGDSPEFTVQTAHLAQFLRDSKPTAIGQAFRRYIANTEATMFGESTPAEAFADAFGSPHTRLSPRQ